MGTLIIQKNCHLKQYIIPPNAILVKYPGVTRMINICGKQQTFNVWPPIILISWQCWVLYEYFNILKHLSFNLLCPKNPPKIVDGSWFLFYLFFFSFLKVVWWTNRSLCYKSENIFTKQFFLNLFFCLLLEILECLET